MIEERVIKVNVNNILGNEFLKPFLNGVLETKMGFILSFNIIITTLIAVQ